MGVGSENGDHWVGGIKERIVMVSVSQRIDTIDWGSIVQKIHDHGYANIAGVFSESECAHLIGLYSQDHLFRKTVSMERYRFGRGEYRYFDYPLPGLLEELRTGVYPRLVPVVNAWNRMLNAGAKYPEMHSDFIAHCRQHGQERPTVLILKYGAAGFNTLHQDLYGSVFFPFQMVLFLNEPGQDYTGGEFVLTEQIPRAQTKAIVLQPRLGDILIFTTNYRPVKGTRGHYRVNMKHGVSEVSSGVRHTLGIIFHDATS